MNRQEVQDAWSRARPVIAPSMLKCDFGRLRDEVHALADAGAGLLHWDVMDGCFVPNLSYGAMVIGSVRKETGLPFEAHLMIAEPARYLPQFLDAGCDVVTFHVEAVDDPGPMLEQIRSAGALSGLALNPRTPVERIEPWLSACDVVLVMSVEPGFGGQKFIPSALDKLRQLRPMLPAGTRLSIDGGIDPQTISAVAEAGADLFVVGSAIFEASDYTQAIRTLQDQVSRSSSSP